MSALLVFGLIFALGSPSFADQDPETNTVAADEVAPLVRLLVFPAMDANGDGHVSFDEFKAVHTRRHSTASDEQIRAVINSGDTDGDGNLDVNEFAAMVSRGFQSRQSEDQSQDRFGTTDTNDDNLLSPEEFRQGFLLHGFHYTEEQTKVLFDYLDENHDGALTEQEGAKMYRNI